MIRRQIGSRLIANIDVIFSLVCLSLFFLPNPLGFEMRLSARLCQCQCLLAINRIYSMCYAAPSDWHHWHTFQSRIPFNRICEWLWLLSSSRKSEILLYFIEMKYSSRLGSWKETGRWKDSFDITKVLTRFHWKSNPSEFTPFLLYPHLNVCRSSLTGLNVAVKRSGAKVIKAQKWNK